MNAISALLTVFSPTGNTVPNVGRLLKKLQPEDKTQHQHKLWLMASVCIPLFAGLIWLSRTMLPIMAKSVSTELQQLPIEILVVGILVAITLSGAGFYFLIQRILNDWLFKQRLGLWMKNMKSQNSLVIYASGSGASGLSRALEAHCGDMPPPNVAMFSHPPKSAEESTSQGEIKGEIKIAGILTVVAPVAPAQGKFTAAMAARRAEADRYLEAHRIFLKEIGAENTTAEIRFIHIGSGSTSLSCNVAWGGAARSTVGMSRSPIRYNIVVSDASQTPDARLPDMESAIVQIIAGDVCGSGVVVTSDGRVITNQHVVGDREMVTVRFPDGYETQGKVEGKDSANDVAYLLCVGVNDLTVLPKGDSDKIRPGDEVTAIGYPQTKIDPSSSKPFAEKAFGSVEGCNTKSIGTDFDCSPGMSGGALINKQGEFIGLVTAVHSEGNQPKTVSITSNEVERIIQSLITAPVLNKHNSDDRKNGHKDTLEETYEDQHPILT